MSTAPQPRHRKGLVMISALGIALSTALAAPATAAALEDGADKRWRLSLPIGSWTGVVEHAEGSGNLTLNFHPNGTVCLFSGAGGAEGGGEGTGTWRVTGPNTFAFQVKERLFEQDGTTAGWVGVNQKAVQDHDSFRSKGISKIYDAAGTYLLSAEARINVTRQSKVPAAC
ncbi:hypothetical protein ACQPZG_22390 [Streptomyces sp. CA-294286]|uniref:hypothetical protein n=1 Tax=Streptomyces sp. CA-294286 TaxID=3240070 RepID=UPI003D941FE0